MTFFTPPIRCHIINVALAVAVCLLIFRVGSAQEVSREDKGRLARIKYLIDQGGKLFKSSDFAESADQIRNAQKEFVKLASSGDKVILKALKNDHERISKAQKLLTEKGQEFDEFPALDFFQSMGGSEPKQDADSEKMETSMGDKEMISFTKQVAPIILEHCGQCHVQQSRGKYSAANYTSLKKGSPKGAAVKPRDLRKSRMIVLIEEGAMPPNGEVPDEQRQILKDWIDQGAKFDGEAKQKNEDLTSFVSADDSSGGMNDGSENSDRGPIGDSGIPSRAGG